MSIAAQNINLTLGNFRLKDISFNIPSGKTAVILGPSGAGKSILLETLAGFYQPQTGRVFIDGHDVTFQPPEKRQVGFVFQDYALFPHYTVQENITFSLRFHDQTSRMDVRQLMNMLRIEHLADRSVAGLSGGEKQRVALARALMTNPRFFLFDEPMSALDTKTKEELRIDLRRLLRELSCTALYVTHDQSEASVLADLIFIMKEGRMVQTGTRTEVFNCPASQFVAKFVGMENVISGELVDRIAQDDGEFRVTIKVSDTDCKQIIHAATKLQLGKGQRVLLGIRPENVELATELEQARERARKNSFLAAVKDILPWGVVYRVFLEGPFPMIAYLSQQQLKKNKIQEGNKVRVKFPEEAIHVITTS